MHVCTLPFSAEQIVQSCKQSVPVYNVHYKSYKNYVIPCNRRLIRPYLFTELIFFPISIELVKVETVRRSIQFKYEVWGAHCLVSSSRICLNDVKRSQPLSPPNLNSALLAFYLHARNSIVHHVICTHQPQNQHSYLYILSNDNAHSIY